MSEHGRIDMPRPVPSDLPTSRPDGTRSRARRATPYFFRAGSGFDPWICGGREGQHQVKGVPDVWYCGQMKPVPSMAEDCEVLHERGFDEGNLDG